MSESIQNNLIPVVATSWNEVAPTLLECASTLELLDSRDVSNDGMNAALAVATTWPLAFVSSGTGALGGLLICLFKSEDGEGIEHRIKQPVDGLPRPGLRALTTSVLQAAAAKLTAGTESVRFDPAIYIDLVADEQRLAAIVGDSVKIGTLSLLLGDAEPTQALVLYAPNGSLETAIPAAADILMKAQPTSETFASPSAPAASAVSQGGGSTTSGERRVDAASRNIERLLEVELDVVVRFGVTNIPLRDVVRMGIGTMIELNRAVDEPVELLVNGRPLARGEVVVVDGYYGVRITEIGAVSDRASIL